MLWTVSGKKRLSEARVRPLFLCLCRSLKANTALKTTARQRKLAAKCKKAPKQQQQSKCLYVCFAFYQTLNAVCLLSIRLYFLKKSIRFVRGIINQNGDPVHPLTVFKQPVPVNGSLQTQHFFATPFSGELTQSEAIDTRKQKIDLTERQCVHADNKPNE